MTDRIDTCPRCLMPKSAMTEGRATCPNCGYVMRSAEKIVLMQGRMDLAYRQTKFAWPWRRWRCTHERQRCIHGDEIIFGTRNFHRARCLDCGKTFPALPEMCFFTDEPHPSMTPVDSEDEP